MVAFRRTPALVRAPNLLPAVGDTPVYALAFTLTAGDVTSAKPTPTFWRARLFAATSWVAPLSQPHPAGPMSGTPPPSAPTLTSVYLRPLSPTMGGSSSPIRPYIPQERSPGSIPLLDLPSRRSRLPPVICPGVLLWAFSCFIGVPRYAHLPNLRLVLTARLWTYNCV